MHKDKSCSITMIFHYNVKFHNHFQPLYSRSSTVFFSLYVLTVFFFAGEAAVGLPANFTVPAVYGFGDSIIDQGNNNYLTCPAKSNFLPYGQDFMGGKPTGRFCNGKTPADFFVERLGVKELAPASKDPNLTESDFITGVSFASAGTGFDDLTAATALAISMPDQLKMFQTYIEKLIGIVGEDRANYIVTNALYFVVSGTDDLANTYFTMNLRRFQYNATTYANYVVAEASKFIQDLYGMGTRKIGVLNVPPIGCLPCQRTIAGGQGRHCVEGYNQAAIVYNSRLLSEINSLNTRLPQAKLVYIDIYTPLLDMIQQPQKYGFKVVDRGCCGTGIVEGSFLCNTLVPTCLNHTEFLFWDCYHPSEQGYKLLVDQIFPTIISEFS